MTANKIDRARAHLATCMERDDFPSHNCACNCSDVAELLAEIASMRAAADVLIPTVIQDICDTPPWAYTYTERPGDLLEIRASELEAILRGAFGQSAPMFSDVSVA